MTFLKLLLATEEMQSQQRTENGVEEIVIGYFSDPDDGVHAYVPEFDVNEFDGMVTASSIDDLPDSVRSVVLAEHHRLTTGEIKMTSEFERG